MKATETTGQDLTVHVDQLDVKGAVIAADGRASRSLRRKLAAGGPVQIRLTTSDDDTTGSALAADISAVVVQAYIGDDTEGHAMTLRFPSAKDAADFRNKLLITGALAATVAVGATAISAGALAPSVTIPQAVTTPATSHGDELIGVRMPNTTPVTPAARSHARPAAPATHGDDLIGARSAPQVSTPFTHGDELIGARSAPQVSTPVTHGDELIGARSQSPSVTTPATHGDELIGARSAPQTVGKAVDDLTLPGTQTAPATHGDELIGARTQSPSVTTPATHGDELIGARSAPQVSTPATHGDELIGARTAPQTSVGKSIDDLTLSGTQAPATHGDELIGARTQSPSVATPATHGDELIGVRSQADPLVGKAADDEVTSSSTYDPSTLPGPDSRGGQKSSSGSSDKIGGK